ncbi:metalloregulator ArsR/SmtB family transcription factor [Bacteriovoracaceae bacterium]|nr:metalloregulator ArsR/SmtB family transcription factor [Bacteriovoracaceae bacterium]
MNQFAALADNTRKEIIELLCKQGEMTATDISNNFKISKPAVSQHLKVLKEFRLVKVKKEAQRRLYSVHSEGLGEVKEWAESMTDFWNSKLNALDNFLTQKGVDNE